MHSPKNLSWLIFIFLIANTPALAKQIEVTIHTQDSLPPYAYLDSNGKVTGAYVEIAKTAFSRMKDYKVTIQAVPWARAKRMAETGKSFAILSPYFHAHDWLTNTVQPKPYLWPYSLPLLTQYDEVICNEKVFTKSRKKWPQDFKGLNFAMSRGDGRAGVQFDKMVKRKEISVTIVKGVESAIKFLLLGRGDCTVASKLTASWHIKKINQKLKNKTNLRRGLVITTNKGYLGYSDINSEKNFPYKKDFSIKFDIEIYKMDKSGEIDKIIQNFANLD